VDQNGWPSILKRETSTQLFLSSNHSLVTPPTCSFIMATRKHQNSKEGQDSITITETTVDFRFKTLCAGIETLTRPASKTPMGHATNTICQQQALGLSLKTANKLFNWTPGRESAACYCSYYGCLKWTVPDAGCSGGGQARLLFTATPEYNLGQNVEALYRIFFWKINANDRSRIGLTHSATFCVFYNKIF
jgi:hypothetical protein